LLINEIDIAPPACSLSFMQLESFKVFCDLVETRSFTKAAQINHITQSAVSQQISALERQFKSPLVERSKKQFRLTEEGEVLYRAAKQIVQTYERLHTELQELKNVIVGTVRVATIYSIGLHSLSDYIKEYLRNYPTVNVHVEYRRANKIYEDVLGNVVDLGIVAYPIRDPKLIIQPLWEEEMVVICHPEHEFAHSNRISLSALVGQRFVAFEPDIPTRKALDKIFREHGVSVVPVMEFDNVETVKRAVEINAGISIVPRATVQQEVEKGTLVALPVVGGLPKRPIAALYKKNKILSLAMRRFLDLLQSKAPEHAEIAMA